MQGRRDHQLAALQPYDTVVVDNIIIFVVKANGRLQPVFPFILGTGEQMRSPLLRGAAFFSNKIIRYRRSASEAKKRSSNS